MELLTIALLALIAGETSYLAYKSIPKNNIEKQSLLIDTSVLIDGRILSIARSGLISAPMIIPRSVIRELQYMADKADHDKRERAREGLDMIEQLKRIEGVTIRVIDDKGSETGVDERLTELARAYSARLCTIDYNLNKAARAQGVIVVNINELAHALRIIHLPGETVRLKLVQTGQESRQAVGYLDDGTMVVVDDAKALIGHEVEAEVTRVLQTTAGKMMFARMISDKKSRNDSTQNRSKTMKSSFGQTRGEGRMIASEETVVSQAHGTGEGEIDNRAQSPKTPGQQNPRKTNSRRRMNGKPQAVPAHNTAEAQDITVVNKEAAPSSQNPNRPRKQYPRNNRRRSPEDSLVDLANE